MSKDIVYDEYTVSKILEAFDTLINKQKDYLKNMKPIQAKRRQLFIDGLVYGKNLVGAFK